MANAVLDWNDVGLAAVLTARQLPPDGARAMAMMHVAMFDAVNAVPVGVSPSAAAASAARTVLLKLFPEQRDAVERAYAASRKAISSEPGIDAAASVGERVANRCLAMRANDGVGAANTYRPFTSPGAYVSTALPVSYEWRAVQPWFMKQPSQYRPEPPPALTSAIWARDYNEIKELGSRASAKRTPEQTETARFWTLTGVASWNPVVRSLTAAQARPLVDDARLFALVNMAATDAFIAVFDAKYAYHFWRPVTAIRNGDNDGNDATAPDASWVPLVDTPLHPEYPCAHCITAGAVAAVLETEFGAGRVTEITMTSATAPGITHRWTRIADYVKEVNNARVWGGIHFRNSTEVGERMGRQIGRLAVTSLPKAAR
jgi:hypothetical protein